VLDCQVGDLGLRIYRRSDLSNYFPQRL